jgi:hypothetical protein
VKEDGFKRAIFLERQIKTTNNLSGYPVLGLYSNRVPPDYMSISVSLRKWENLWTPTFQTLVQGTGMYVSYFKDRCNENSQPFQSSFRK